MRPPEFTGGNLSGFPGLSTVRMGASMRPPEFTGGNLGGGGIGSAGLWLASMRPPEFTGGNRRAPSILRRRPRCCFNEAAGIHRRKPVWSPLLWSGRRNGFNEAAGIHRRKPPELTVIKKSVIKLQ